MSILTAAKGLLTGGLATLWSKLGLYLGYLAIGIAITLGCAAVWFYKQNGELHEAVATQRDATQDLKGQVATLEANNASQDAAIDALTELRKKDNKVVNSLINDVKGISQTTTATKTKLRDLENHSDQVKSYIDTPLPANVRRVLNGQDAISEPAPATSANGNKGGAS